jgi:S-sulfo-L-cysteine synthase (O-acetyl-L-serine-dependent)
VLTPADEGSDGAIRKVREIYAADPDRYFYADQYNNDANWQAHYETTGPRSSNRPKAASRTSWRLLGTSGTFIGNSRRFARSAACRVHLGAAVDRIPRHRRHEAHADGDRARHLRRQTGRPQSLDRDRRLPPMVKRLAREEGLLVGISGGGNVVAALTIARSCTRRAREGVIVTILCDSADKYLSEHFWDEED